MSEIDQFRSLAAAAAREQVPLIDVTARVLERIAPRWERRGVDVPLAVFSGASAVAASIAVAVALHAFTILSDPLGGLFQPLTMVMR